MKRRLFILGTASTAVASSTLTPRTSAAQATDLPDTPSRRRVGVIGHTGRGNYGHGLDTVWLKLDDTEIVAVADADATGLQAAKKRLRIDTGYADYRKMLDETRPEIVAVCPRHPDQHRDMTIAAIRAGAKAIYLEKPFCRTPAEADEIVAACDDAGTKLAVAHRNRYHPALPVIRRLVNEGLIGRPLEIRGRGKGDRRGGAEDLWVLGSHVLNLMHFLGGPAKSCSAILRENGQPVTADDVHDGNEGLGPLAGNELHARYELERDPAEGADPLIAYFDSITNDGTGGAAFGLQLIGSEGSIDLNCDQYPLAHLVPGNPFAPTQKPRPWIPISSAGVGLPEPHQDLRQEIGHHVTPARDLIDSIDHDRQPLCDAHEAAMTVEMICATFASHRANGATIPLPIPTRTNELANL